MLDKFLIALIILAIIDIMLPPAPVASDFVPWWRILPGAELALWLLYWYYSSDK